MLKVVIEVTEETPPEELQQIAAMLLALAKSKTPPKVRATKPRGPPQPKNNAPPVPQPVPERFVTTPLPERFVTPPQPERFVSPPLPVRTPVPPEPPPSDVGNSGPLMPVPQITVPQAPMPLTAPLPPGLEGSGQPRVPFVPPPPLEPQERASPSAFGFTPPPPPSR